MPASINGPARLARSMVCLLAVLLLTFGPAQAQKTPESEAVPQPSTDIPRRQVLSLAAEEGSAQASSLDALPDALSGNTILVRQIGNLNNAELLQIGIGNTAVAIQRGRRNDTRIIQQGDFNTVNSLLNGSNNDLLIRQFGNENEYLFEYRGSGLNHEMTQIGNSLQATQVGSTAVPFSIEQYGSGMDLVIEHN